MQEILDKHYAPGGRIIRAMAAKLLAGGRILPHRDTHPSFAAGHRIRLVLTSDDQDPATPAIMSFRHASVGTSSLNTVFSSSRLLLPVLSG